MACNLEIIKKVTDRTRPEDAFKKVVGNQWEELTTINKWTSLLSPCSVRFHKFLHLSSCVNVID